MNATPRTRRTPRFTPATVLAAALAAAGALIWAWQPWDTTAPSGAASELSEVVTAPVERGTLTSELRLTATLGHGDPVELPVAAGVITALPAPGQVIDAGSWVYEADGRPVILLEGARPLWRDLTSGIDQGHDVLQLEQNLARLGFFDREPDTRFDWWTVEAINRWQKDLGLPVTGTVAVSDVVVADAPSIRVSQITGQLGQTGVSPLTYTATTLQAVATLTAAQSRELQAGTPVTVTLPDGTELDNTLAAVDPGGHPTDEGDQVTPPTARIEFPDQDLVSATGPTTIQVTVHNNEDATETLIVPATSLIATARDSYAVEVRTDEQIVRVPVMIGLVADARVQILASGADLQDHPANTPTLSAGDEVVIAR